MNKIFSKLLAMMLVLVACFSLTACKEVENGVEIHRVKMTIAFTDEDGTVTDYDVFAKFYVNNAPETVAHIENLINDGYYNNVDITNATSSYFQFGDAVIGKDGKLDFSKDKDVSRVNGEFLNNGWKGNNLHVGAGSILLKHAKEGVIEGDKNISKYNTAKATIVVSMTSSAPFDNESYCVFGKFVSDDGKGEEDDSSMANKSSLDKILEIANRISDSNGRKLYYCVKDETKLEENDQAKAADNSKFNWEGKYITSIGKDENIHYYEGIYSSNEIVNGTIAHLSEEEENDIKAKLDKDATNFMCIPTLRVVIKNVSMVK